ncbi:MAG: hypothetical protein R6V76_07970 [Desulfobacterales bacterium]
MNKSNDSHLNKEQIYKAIIDESELLSSEREHLSGCSECRAELENFEQDLKLLRQTAERFVLPPKNRMVFHEKTGKNSLFGWRTSFATAIMILFFVITMHSDSIKLLFYNKTNIVNSEIYSEDILMTEVNNLVENSLPAKYFFISDDENIDYDEDFIDFVIPPIDDDLLSGIKKEGYVS